MNRAWLALAVASALAAFGLAALARAPRPAARLPVERAHPVTRLSLSVEHGTMNPAVATVRKGERVELEIQNRDRRPIRLALSGYEERVRAARIAPDSTWRTVFLADRPGDEFEWQVDGHPAGRLIVFGSHLEEGHE